MAQDSGSTSAASARSTASASRWTLRTGATVSSAVEPSVRATPEPSQRSQRLERPAVQYWHSPQNSVGSTDTRSPGAT